MRKLLFILLFIPSLLNAITPIFCCGFECGQLGSVGQHYGTATGISISTSTVRSGDRSLNINISAASGQAPSLALSSSAIWVIRAYIRFSSLPTSTCTLILTNTNACGVQFNSSDSKLYPYNGSSAGSSGITVTTGVWYRIDLKIDLSNNPWTIDLSVDGAATTQLTRAVAADSETRVNLGSNTSTTMNVFYDDVLYSNTSGDYPINGGQVFHFIPTADGSHSGLTANDFERTLTGTDILNSTTDSYLLLDDVPLESGSSVDWINMVAPVASTYVENVFGPASGISTPTTAPRMVSVIIGIHAAGTGNYNAEWLLNDNGSTGTIFSASAVAGTTSIIYKTLNLADPPSAASTWTLSGNGNFNDIRVRFGPTGTVDANPDVYFDCAMIEAEFEEVALTVPGSPTGSTLSSLGAGKKNLDMTLHIAIFFAIVMIMMVTKSVYKRKIKV